MCDYSSYIFEEGVKQGVKQAEKKAIKIGRVLGAVVTMRDFGASEEEILQRIIKKYQISEDDAKRLMDEAKELV